MAHLGEIRTAAQIRTRCARVRTANGDVHAYQGQIARQQVERPLKRLTALG
jgi:hypothetical protein